VGCFRGYGLPKASQQPGQPEEIPHEAAAEIPLEKVHATIAEWPEHLEACIAAEDGHFE